MTKLFSSLENNTHLLNLPSTNLVDTETTSIDVFDENGDEIVLTDIEDTAAAIDEGGMYANIMMETYSAISKEEIGSDSYIAVCSLSRKILNALPDRLNLKKYNSMPAIEDVSHRYDVYDSIAKESIIENVKKVVMEIWRFIKELIDKRIASYKRLLMALLNSNKEKQKTIKVQIDEIKGDKNKYKAVDGEITLDTLSQVLNLNAADITRQGDVTKLLVATKDKFKYTDINQFLSHIKTDGLIVIDYLLWLNKLAAMNGSGKSVPHDKVVEAFNAYTPLFKINYEFKYSTPLAEGSKVTINTKRHEGKLTDISPLTDIIDRTDMVKFEPKPEEALVQLSKDIDEISTLNDAVNHINAEVTKTMDRVVKSLETFKKDTETTTKEFEKATTVAKAANPANYDITLLSQGITFVSIIKQAPTNLQMEILENIKNELIFTYKYTSQLERFILASLETFKPAN